MNTSKLLVGLLAVTTLVFGVLFVKKPAVVSVGGSDKAPVVNVPAPVVNVQVPEQPTPVVNVNVPKQSPVFGASAGPETGIRNFFRSGLASGGKVATSSTAATYTTAASDFAGTPTMILWTPNLDTTISLSATSTHAYVPEVGDTATIYLLNASTTATSAMTFAAKDANTDLQFTEATGGDLVLNGLDWVKLTLIRQTGYKVSILFSEFTEAD